MTRYFIFTLFFVCFTQNIFSQVNISLWHPIAIGSDSTRKTRLSLGLLQSRTNNINGLGLNLIGGEVHGQMKGLEVGGIYSYIEKDLKGISFGGLLNVVKGGGKGLTISGLLNMSVDAYKGFQFSGVSNMSIKEMKGFQISSIYNVASSNVSGFQFAGISNIAAKGSKTVQVSGIFNISLEGLKGIQISPTNFADTIKGIQFGVVNVSRKVEKGLQLGFINFHSDSTGIHLAFLNMTPKSRINMQLSIGNFTLLNVASIIRNRNNYMTLGLGFSYDKLVEASGALFLRRGYSIPIERFRLNADFGFAHIIAFENNNFDDAPLLRYSLQPRLGIEYKVHSRLSFFVSGGCALTSFYGYTNFAKKLIAEAGIILF